MATTDHQERREAIRKRLLTTPATTQAALVKALMADGFVATQSSVSRDLRELGAIKTADGYELSSADIGGDQQMAAVADLLRSTETAGPNLLVVRTAIGAAQRVALALDRCDWPGVIGNIGGDDTVFVATKNGTAQKNLVTRIEQQLR